MRQVTCKKLGSVTSLTVGNSYTIVSETENRFAIVNDKGVQANYGKNLFEEPVEMDAEQAAPRRRPGRPSRADIAARQVAEVPAAVPQRPPVRVVDSIDVNVTAINDGGDVSIAIVADFGGGFNYRHESGTIFSTSDISASCGIRSLSGLDTLQNTLNLFRNRLDVHIRDNAHNFQLNNIDLDELFTGVVSAVLQEITSTYQGEDADVRAGVLILSTTRNHINNMPVLRDALNELSSSTIEVRNPNSGNDIVMWNIAVEA